MKISGFSFVRNGINLHYPVVESIKSILPICEEFIVAVGKGSENDTTRQEIEAISDSKIKIIDTEWEEKYHKAGSVYALQTDLAKNVCSGDWLFYLQADEVVHEKYLPVIRNRCQALLSRNEVEGLIFKYKHFWGDYSHYQNGHGWYPYEVRIIRNLPQTHSWKDAQSFRFFENYSWPMQTEGTKKLQVAKINAEIYHYGWVRPPKLMQSKRKTMDSIYWGKKNTDDKYKGTKDYFDYGPLNRLAVFREKHPEVMHNHIKLMDWKDKLQYSGKPNRYREKNKHEKLKYRILSFIENRILGGKHIGGFKNYILLKNL
jgi:hypothetical protein